MFNPERREDPNIEIEVAKPEDSRDIWDVQYKTSIAKLPDEKLGVTVDDIKDSYKDLYSADGTLTEKGEQELEKEMKRLKENPLTDSESFVAKNNGKVIGFVTVNENSEQYPGKNQLVGMYILPEFGGQGIGTKLWEQGLEFIDPAQETVVSLYSHNTPATEFYKKLGFEDTGTRKEVAEKSGAKTSTMEMVLRAREKIEYPEIAFEIKQMKSKDQKARNNMKTAYKLDLELQELDRKHTKRMKEIVEQIGWPTIPKVGENGSNSAWLLVQHSDLEFMRKCLDLMKRAPGEEINKINIAYLDDRIRAMDGKPQIYGTQYDIDGDKPVLLPVEDIEKADILRKEIGMRSLKEDMDEYLGMDKNQ